jgi:serine/threonine-protein kinase HipA
VRPEPIRAVVVATEFELGRRVRVGRLALKDRELLFEYDAAFLTSRLELSPFRLPLRPGVVIGDPTKFDGLMGVFDDSLPDGWGRLLIDRAAARQGISPRMLTPLDRLAVVGRQGMGALVYEPELTPTVPETITLREIEEDARLVLEDADEVALDRLIAIGGSPQGARPKALIQLADDGRTIHSGTAPRSGCTYWMVKFRSREDAAHAGTLEHAYTRMAAAAGIDVPRTRMLGRTPRHPGYFAVERFDRSATRRFHLHTLAGLLHAPLGASVLSYSDLLQVTRALTRDESAVAEMFRRACFNVLAHNRDDHARNFAFLMDEMGRWRPSPAFDLTYSDGPGGEHTLLVANEGARPTRDHLLAVARENEVRRAADIVDEVSAAVQKFARFAEEAGLPRRVLSTYAKRLHAPVARPGKKAARRK